MCSEDEKKGPADVDGNHAGAEVFPIGRGGRRPLAAPRRRVPPSGDSGDADVDEAVIGSVSGPDNGCRFLAEPCERYEVGTDVTVDVLGGSVTGLHALVLLQGIWVRAESMTDVIEYVSEMAAADAERKNGRLRLIVDARECNQWLERPPSTEF